MDDHTEYYWFKSDNAMDEKMEVIYYQTKCPDCAKYNTFKLKDLKPDDGGIQKNKSLDSTSYGK